MRRVIDGLVDRGSARSSCDAKASARGVTALARIGGVRSGAGQQPDAPGGAIDADAADKAARFI